MSNSHPAPGWYPDPAGGGSRWWTGRDWGVQQQQPGPVPIVQPPLPAGTSTDTRWAVLQALLPVASLAAMVPYLLSFQALFGQQFALMRQAGPSGELPPSALKGLFGDYASAFGAFGLTMLISLLIAAAFVLFAVLDVRALERRGIVQPFHWAWSFLSLVYPIGRAVVVHRRTGGGLRPLWILIVAYVGTLVIMFVAFGIFFGTLFASLPTDFSSYSTGA